MRIKISKQQTEKGHTQELRFRINAQKPDCMKIIKTRFKPWFYWMILLIMMILDNQLTHNQLRKHDWLSQGEESGMIPVKKEEKKRWILTRGTPIHSATLLHRQKDAGSYLDFFFLWSLLFLPVHRWVFSYYTCFFTDQNPACWVSL